MKDLVKRLKNMDRQVLMLVGVCVLILLVVLFYPRKSETGVKLVPVQGTTYYKAVFENMENKKEPTIVFFGTEWCGYCKKFKPEWDNFTKNFPKIKTLYIDADNKKEVAKKHQIKGFPTVKFLPNGIDDSTGSQTMNSANNYASLVEFSSNFF